MYFKVMHRYSPLLGVHTDVYKRQAIDRELNPFFYSKTGRFIKGILKLAGKVVFKTSVDFNEMCIRDR